MLEIAYNFGNPHENITIFGLLGHFYIEFGDPQTVNKLFHSLFSDILKFIFTKE